MILFVTCFRFISHVDEYLQSSFIWKTKQFIHFNNYQLQTVKCHFITDERTGETSSHSTNTLQVVLVTTFSVILSKEFGNFTISSLGMSVHYRNSISKLSIITIRGQKKLYPLEVIEVSCGRSSEHQSIKLQYLALSMNTTNHHLFHTMHLLQVRSIEVKADLQQEC